VGKAINVVTASHINGTASIAMSSSGSFVVAWASTGNDLDIFAQRYSNAGKAVGSRITVTAGALAQSTPTVATDASGNFVIVWEEWSQGGRAAQIFNADGTRRGSIFQYTASGLRENRQGAVAMDASGIVFAYQFGDFRSGHNIFARRYTTTGVALSAEFQVNSGVGVGREKPSVAMTGNGGFVIDWSGRGDGDDSGVFFQRYAAPSPLMAASAGTDSDIVTLSQDALAPLVQEAIARREATSLTDVQLNLLWNATIQVADLGGSTLGLTVGNTIWIDDDAAGWGWFLDSTPSDDREVRRRGDQGETGRMDLLTVLMHEMGHTLGLDHESGGVMQETLAPDVRWLPEDEAPTVAAIDPFFEAAPGSCGKS
jgi:hypothetical protein